MTCWPFKPEPDKILETLAWGTNVIPSVGKQQRNSYRPVPHQEWELEHQLIPADYFVAKELARQYIDQSFYLPVWPEMTNVGAISASTTVLSIDASEKCYAEGEKLFLWDSNSYFEECTIYSIGVGTIQINPGTTKAFNNALAAPMRNVQFHREFSADRAFPGLGQARVNFVCTATEDLSAETGLVYPDYLGYPCITDPNIIVNGAEDQIDPEVDIFDTRSGPIWRKKLYDGSNQKATVAWVPLTRHALWLTRVFLHQRRGRQKKFWLPTWIDDLEITDDIAEDATTIEVTDPTMSPTYPCDFVILTTSGVLYGFRVNSMSAGDPGKKICNLATAMPVAIPLSTIVGTYRIIQSCFASDRIEIAHKVGGAASIVVPVEEVPT